MKYIEWLWNKRRVMVLTIVAAIVFPVGWITAAATSNDLDKQHQAAVATGALTVCETEVEQPEECRTDAAPVPEECRTYFDVPLSEDLQNHIFQLCEEKGIDPAIIVAMCFRESTYNANCIGDNGNSYGLMQIQKRHHLERMERLGVTNLLDPYGNISVGVDFFAELLGKYDGNVLMALTAYNCGASGAYNNYFSKGVYANNYAKDVMEKAGDLTA